MSEQAKTNWKETILWWVTLFLKPALLLGAGVLLIVALGVAQRRGWLSAGAGGTGNQPKAATEEEDVLYICPMQCTPPLGKPGRCPVCGMELVPSSSGDGKGDGRSIQIDPASRRVANIRTVAVKSVAASREIRAVGVRVVISNEDGRLKIGDYATAAVEVPVTHPATGGKVLVVPRNAVLMAGDHSVVYVDTKSGRFELRRVEPGPTVGRDIVLLSGVKEGERVATSGNFLIDSEMQLAGNPSLIDPTKADEPQEPAEAEGPSAPDLPPIGPIQLMEAAP